MAKQPAPAAEPPTPEAPARTAALDAAVSDPRPAARNPAEAGAANDPCRAEGRNSTKRAALRCADEPKRPFRPDDF